MSNQFLEDVNSLIAELEGVADLLEDHRTEDAIDELECQSGTIETMLSKLRLLRRT